VGAGFLAAGLLLSMPMLPARAEDYPDHTIKFVVPQPPGGGADILARQLADGLGQLSGQPVVIENKPGAGGTIGTQAVAAARPDGYTVLYATSNMLSGNFFLYKNLPYTADDFEAVTTLNRSPFVLVVAGNSPFHSVADLTAFLKEKKGAAKYGTPTSISLASTEIYLDQAGVAARRIPYKASAMAVNDLISGDIDFFLSI
jgi:tripartite-type tricarboxylate transporter receptor subunit TctC